MVSHNDGPDDLSRHSDRPSHHGLHPPTGLQDHQQALSDDREGTEGMLV